MKLTGTHAISKVLENCSGKTVKIKYSDFEKRIEWEYLLKPSQFVFVADDNFTLTNSDGDKIIKMKVYVGKEAKSLLPRCLNKFEVSNIR